MASQGRCKKKPLGCFKSGEQKCFHLHVSANFRASDDVFLLLFCVGASSAHEVLNSCQHSANCRNRSHEKLTFSIKYSCDNFSFPTFLSVKIILRAVEIGFFFNPIILTHTHVFSALRNCYQAKITHRWCSERIISDPQGHLSCFQTSTIKDTSCQL